MGGSDHTLPLLSSAPWSWPQNPPSEGCSWFIATHSHRRMGFRRCVLPAVHFGSSLPVQGRWELKEQFVSSTQSEDFLIQTHGIVGSVKTVTSDLFSSCQFHAPIPRAQTLPGHPSGISSVSLPPLASHSLCQSGSLSETPGPQWEVFLCLCSTFDPSHLFNLESSPELS